MKCTRCGEEASFVEEHDDWWCSKCERYVLPAPGASKSKPPAPDEFVAEDIDALNKFLSPREATRARRSAIHSVVLCIVMFVAFSLAFVNQRMSLRSAKVLVALSAADGELAPNLQDAVLKIEEVEDTANEVTGLIVVLLGLAAVVSIFGARAAGQHRRVAEILRSERGVRFLEVGRRRSREP